MSQGEGRHSEEVMKSHVGTVSSGHPYGTLGNCLFWCGYGRIRIKAGLCGSQVERQHRGAEGVDMGAHAHGH